MKAIDPAVRTQRRSGEPDSAIASHHVDAMEELYSLIHKGDPIPSAALERMNRVQEELAEQWGTPSKDRAREEGVVEGAD